jgi:hypothetical protein
MQRFIRLAEQIAMEERYYKLKHSVQRWNMPSGEKIPSQVFWAGNQLGI